VQEEVGYKGLLYDDHIGKVSLIGAGMRSHPGVAATFFASLGNAGVNIEMISTSEIRVSVVCRDTDLDVAVRAIHDAFELGGADEAVVYAGTGR
jgi:aspartate kinase